METATQNNPPKERKPLKKLKVSAKNYVPDEEDLKKAQPAKPDPASKTSSEAKTLLKEISSLSSPPNLPNPAMQMQMPFGMPGTQMAYQAQQNLHPMSHNDMLNYCMNSGLVGHGGQPIMQGPIAPGYNPQNNDAQNFLNTMSEDDMTEMFYQMQQTMIDEDGEAFLEENFPQGAEDDYPEYDDSDEAIFNEIEKRETFREDCKHCECCRGYIYKCSSQICDQLGSCHCVARTLNEEEA